MKQFLLLLAIILSVGNLTANAFTYSQLCKNAYLYTRANGNRYKKTLKSGERLLVLDYYSKRKYVREVNGSHGFVNNDSFCN